MKKQLVPILMALCLVIGLFPTTALAAEDTPDGEETAATYEVSTDAELQTALDEIKTAGDEEAVIVLNADVTAPAENYVSTFGVDGKHITVQSADGELFALKFSSRGILNGDCTFDNVNVTGRRLYCNGFRTIFTENGEIHLSETLYGGGYKTTVDSTYVVIAADGYINPSSSSGLHDVVGGSYQASVVGDTYLEITGSLQMQGGNILTPACMMGDGTSGDGRNSPDVYVGGNATLVYDTDQTSSPAIAGSDGCEIRGDLTLDVRAGRCHGIDAQYEYETKSMIRGNVHLIAGAEKYEGTDHVLRITGNWPISGAGCRRYSTATHHTVGGNVVVDTYENLWGWDKNGSVPGDVPEIYGAYGADVSGSVTVNAHGSHMENITGACDSNIGDSVTINATDVELKNSYYETKYDEGDIYGLYEAATVSTANGPVTINVNGGDTALLLATDQGTVNSGSSINVTGEPKIRVGVLGTTARTLGDGFPTVNVQACKADIPFIQAASKINITDNAEITVHEAELDYDLNVEEGSSLTTEDSQIHLWGNAVVNGTWEQKYDEAADYNDIYVKGTTDIGENGRLIDHGTSDLKGAVTNNGLMALMAPAYLQSDYTATNAELRLPAVTDNYDGTDEGGDIPLFIKGISKGTTTVNTVQPNDWTTLQMPKTGENYILSAKDGYAPLQKVFLLGNEDALERSYFLKRLNDADTTDDTYYMWQVASGIRVIFDKNGGDTEASPRIIAQDKVEGTANHFDLPTTEPTRTGYQFKDWNTKADGTGETFTAETDVRNNMTVYAQWEPDEAYAVKIAPMDLTIYVGGDGYHGVIGDDNEFDDDNDLPEIGFYLTLPDDVNAMLGSTADNPVDLSDKLRMTYDDENGTTRSWSLEQYGDETMSQVTVNGQKVYIYKLLSSKVDGTEEMIPARVQYTRADGSVMVDSEFKALIDDQFRNYKISFFPGQLDEQIYKATFTTTDGRTLTRPIKLGTGTLKVRGNTDESYREIEANKTPSVDPQDKGLMLASTAQENTQYYLNNSGVSADAAGIKLLVDHSLDDALLNAYIARTSNTEGKYTCQFRYLDLVDTSNGNAYVTMGEGQSMNLYWPVPSDAAANSAFHIIHFKGIDRDSNADVNDLLTTHIPEEITGEKVTIDGQQFIQFSTDSFSPFALLYEKAAPSNSGSSSGGHSTSVPDLLNGDDHDAYIVGYSDGTVQPNANISRAEVATIFFRQLKAEVRDGNLTADNGFSDVTEGQWYDQAISTMAKLGIVNGRDAETFAPNAPITRAEFAAICARFDTKQTSGSSSFSDLSGHWAEQEIERAAALGWIAGYPDGTFRPDQCITRAEAMTMINRVLCRTPQSADDLLPNMVTWPDNQAADWYYLAVQEATNSHDFVRKGQAGETWSKLTPVRDWTQYQ